MVASSTRNDATHTTHTDDSLKPIKWVHHDLEHATDMVRTPSSDDYGGTSSPPHGNGYTDTPAHYLFDQMTNTIHAHCHGHGVFFSNRLAVVVNLWVWYVQCRQWGLTTDLDLVVGTLA
jgi:hypothetical protein